MTNCDCYRRWFEYEKDSHAKVLESLARVPEQARSSASFQKALSLMAHIAAARQLWLFRFGVAKEAPREFLPANVDLAELRSTFERIHSAWQHYLEDLSDGQLRREFEYRSLEGAWFRNTIEDILTQLFGHSWYHRGQIAALVRSLGAQPAVTDFVYWARQPIQPPPGA